MKEIYEKLATEILPKNSIDDFLSLPEHSQAIGLAVIAHIGGDFSLRDKILNQLMVLS